MSDREKMDILTALLYGNLGAARELADSFMAKEEGEDDEN